MHCKNIYHYFGFIFIAISSIAQAQGSILIYNNSLYQIKCIVTTQNNNVPSYSQTVIACAPTLSDGSLQLHPVDTNYIPGSNVPVGTIANVQFSDPAKDFDIQILDTMGKVIKQINIGTSLGQVVDNDPARVVYVYNNLDNAGVVSPNNGGAVFFWDSAHSLQSPSAQPFPAVTNS